MLNTILILLIIIVVYKIFLSYNEKFKNINKNTTREPYINITNPFVQGLSQAQLGADMIDKVSNMNKYNLPSTNQNVLNTNIQSSGEKRNSIPKNINNKNIINNINKLYNKNNSNNSFLNGMGASIDIGYSVQKNAAAGTRYCPNFYHYGNNSKMYKNTIYNRSL
jgi:hypothetical protein